MPELEKKWEKDHMIQSAECAAPLVPLPPGTFVPKQCLALRFCVCESKRYEAHCCHAKLVQLMRPYVAAKRVRRKKDAPKLPKEPPKPARRLLESTSLCVKLSGAVAAGEFAGRSWQALGSTFHARTPDPGAIDASAARGQEWFVITYMNFSTFNFSAMRMEELETVVTPGGIRIHLKLRDPLTVCHSREFLFRFLELRHEYRAQWYEIVTDVEIDTMIPNRVWVQEVMPHVMPPSCPWQGSAQEHINASRPKITGNRGGQKRKPGAKSQGRGGQAKRRRQRREQVQDANEPDDAANHVDMAEQMADEHHDPDAEDGIVNGDAQDGEDSAYSDGSEGQPSWCFGF